MSRFRFPSLRGTTLFPFLLLSAATAAAADAPTPATAPPQVEIQVAPATVYVERLPEGQAVNFDLRVRNPGGSAVTLTRVQVDAFDAAGARLLQRLIDGNGVHGSIETLPNREVAPGQAQTLFNPFHLFAGELPLARLHYTLEFSDAGAATVIREFDVAPIAYVDHTRLQLPLRGRLLNYDGHDYYGHHRRFDPAFAPIAALGFDRNFMRYSYDFVPVDAAGAMHRGDGAANADWFGFGNEVRAAGAGTVVLARDGDPDNRQFDQGKLATDPMVLFGNVVVIDHGHGEFSVYGHLQQGSVRVHAGDAVAAGAPIARVGASGSALFPHLHFELQDGPGIHAEGLPSYFADFDRVLGAHRVPRTLATVDTGEIVEAR